MAPRGGLFLREYPTQPLGKKRVFGSAFRGPSRCDVVGGPMSYTLEPILGWWLGWAGEAGFRKKVLS